MEAEDPFALRPHILHPILAENRVIGSNVDRGLFDRFFASFGFTAWSSGTRSWQLHCYGEPGCGKTTAAAVAASKIPPELNGTRTAVASISVRGHIVTTSLHFVEDLLYFIYDAFGKDPSAEFSEYQAACQKGKPIIERIQKLSIALINAAPSACKFLILDGYDRINEALQSVVDIHLSLLQSNGMRIMTTRRVPIHETPHNEVCDECDHPNLRLWWQCSRCAVFYLCYKCKRNGQLKKPHHCEDFSWEETYSHVSVELGSLPIDDFVAKNINLYHPELEPQICQHIINYVVPQVGGNITLALLYLEHVFAQDDYMSLDAGRVEDRLPREVIAFFDAEMKSIERRPEPQRLPTLLAISAAARTDWGVPLAELQEHINHAQSAFLNLDYPRGAEDIFKTSHGWLSNTQFKQREVDISCRPAFMLYVEEGYNESFAWAKRQLGFDHETTMIKPEDSRTVLKKSSSPLQKSTSSIDSPGSINDVRKSPDPAISDKPVFANQKDFVMSPRRMDSTDTPSISTLPMQTKATSSSNSTDIDDSPSLSHERICNFCLKRILKSGASAGHHRTACPDAHDPISSCIFCSSLYSTNTLSDASSHQWAWPIYHWTFRALPRGRELKRSMILKFWPVSPGLTAKSFHFLRTPNLHIPSKDTLPPSTNPDVSGGDQIRDWIDTCSRHHAGCGIQSRPKTGNQKRNDVFLPTRLIDVDTGDDNIVRLVETKVTKVKGPYCTLSHAWGPQNKKPLMTTVWNMAEHLLTGIEWKALPPNFQQAIAVTRFLKVRYIWIDSLTIVQAPYGDFEEEGDLMHKVYRNSYCNIVAADASDKDGGLFRQRVPSNVLPVRFCGTEVNQGLGTKEWAIVPADMWERELLDSFIYTRAWVFQERMLSPRLLHFTRHQIFWDCSSLSACEAFPAGIPFSLDHKASTDRHWRGRLEQSGVPSNALSGANDNESSYTFWLSAVQAYTDCNLTNQNDKTKAIWSAAKLLRDVSKEKYAVGMWSVHLEEQLAWTVREVEKSERPPELQSRVPSWSWASIKASIVPQHRLAERSYKVNSHEGNELAMCIKEIKDEDKEPELESRRLAFQGFLSKGHIIAANGSYRLKIPVDTDRSIYLDAFPDELPSQTPIFCTLTILAASASALTSLPSPCQPKPIPASTSYSGIGLLLIDPFSWYAEQDNRFHAFLAEVGKGELADEKKWRKEAYEKLLVNRPKVREDKVYRRMGVVHFQGLEASDFEWLTRGEHVNFRVE